MLNLLLGTSGSGKSTRLMQTLKAEAEAGRRSILIVPEQFTSSTEGALYRLLGDTLSGYVESYSFTSLAETLLRRYGGAAVPTLDEAGRAVLERAFGTQTANQLLEKVTKSLKNREFSFLNKADEKSLYAALQHERPQTIALVLSYVDPEKSAAVIDELDPERQVKVVESIANMESASPAAVKIIEAEMEKRFSSIMTTNNVKVGGVDYVAGVMNNLDRASEKSIFDRLSAHNEALADEIRKRMFVFEDIVTMDDRSVQRFVRDCDPKDLVLALKGANHDVANKIFSNVSARMAQSIRDDLEVTVNVRIRDVEAAQQRIVGIIRDLEEKNELIILKGGKDDIIA